MFEVNAMSGLQATQLLVVAAVFFLILLWAVPALHRHVLPSSMRNDAVARAATVAGILVIAAAAATIGLRGSSSAIARSDKATMAIDELQRGANTPELPNSQYDPY